MEFLSQIINGLHVGSIYALVALGYNMVYGIIQLINFAHGDIIMVGSYAAYVVLAMLGLPLWVAVIISIAFCALLGMFIERIAYRRLLKKNAPRISLLITAIVVNIDPITVGDKQISFITIITIIVTVLLMIGLQILVKNARMGKAMRAVSEDPQASQLMGINTSSVIAFTFGLGSGLAAVGSVLYSAAYPLVTPYMGSLLGLKAFVAAVLGGIGSIPGAMLGGYVIGVAESLTKGYISTQLADAVVFGILIIVLIFKPSGLLGKNIKEKV